MHVNAVFKGGGRYPKFSLDLMDTVLKAISCLIFSCPVAPLSFQSKGNGFDSQRIHAWLQGRAGMRCKSLWLKAFAKCINANVFLVTKRFSTQPVFQKWFDIVTHWEEMTETKPLVVVEVSVFIFVSLSSCSQFKSFII